MFKLGDKVRIIGNTNGSENRVGDIGVVSKIEAGRSSMLVWTDRTHGSTRCWTILEEVELVEKEELKESTKYKCYMCESKFIHNVATVESRKEVPLCEEHYAKIYSVKDRSQKIKVFGKDSPKGIIISDRTFGVELECFTRTNINRNVAWHMIDPSFGCHVDGSVRGDSGYEGRMELGVGVLMNSEGEKMLTDTCKLLASIDTKANDSCGTHCHIGIPESKKDNKQSQILLKRLFLFYTVFEPVIRCLLPENRRDTGYCAPLASQNLIEIDKTTGKPCGTFAGIERFEDFWSSGGYKGRYGVNFNALSEHGTLEIRYHEGTIDPVRLIHWIALHAAIVDLVMNDEISDDEIAEYAKTKSVNVLLNQLLTLLKGKIKLSTKRYTLGRFEEYKELNPKDGYINTVGKSDNNSSYDSDDDDEDEDSDDDY